jgi:pyruvate/2-oxoglutarate/acetoin dehydrogenase E1 component
MSTSFADLINEAYCELLSEDDAVIAYGLGIDDPKHIFGTTRDLRERFGSERVFDIPTSENALTGVGVGAAIAGLKPILCHQRLDFALLSVDQLVNSAAKWHFMFGNQFTVPLTVRLIVGRGWGQGPTHSQSLQSWFAHIPGLRTVLPSRAETVKSLFKQAVLDPNPCIFIEHRWLHNLNLEQSECKVSLDDGCDVLLSGPAITMVSSSYQSVVALQAARFMESQGLAVTLLDVFELNENSRAQVRESVSKTGRLICLETSHRSCSVASEIIADVAQTCLHNLHSEPVLLAKPDYPEPTSFALTKSYYQSTADIIQACAKLAGVSMPNIPERYWRPEKHDVPGDWFKGPF